MAFFLFILEMILKALPLVIPAFIAGAKMGSNGDEGTLAASAAGIPDGWANVIIWGCVAVFIIGQASGWTMKGFFSWVRGIWASIVQSWKDAAPAPTPPAPQIVVAREPYDPNRRTYTVAQPVPPAAPVATPTPPTP